MDVLLLGLNQELDKNGILSKNETSEFPGLNYLSEYLERKGIQNEIIFGKDNCDAKGLIKDYSPKIVGFSVFGNNYSPSVNLAEKIKEISPETKIVFGGPFASNLKNVSFPVDYIISGEGEKAFCKLAEEVLSGRSLEDKIFLSERLNSQELNEVHFENLHKNNLQFYKKHIPHSIPFSDMKYALVVGSRGCVFDCDFCSSKSIWNKNVTFRDPKNIVEELKFLEREGTNYIGFMDDDFLMNNRNNFWTEKIAEGIIDSGINLNYHVMASVKGASKFKNYDLLKESGCAEISLGMESLEPKVINSMGKNFSFEELENSLNKIYSSGIYPSLYVLFGHPDSTRGGLKNQYNLMKKLPWLRIRTGFVIPFPGTRLFEKVENENLWLNKEDKFRFMTGDRPVIKTEPSSEYLIESRNKLLNLYYSKEYSKRFKQLAKNNEKSLKANYNFLNWLKPQIK